MPKNQPRFLRPSQIRISKIRDLPDKTKTFIDLGHFLTIFKENPFKENTREIKLFDGTI